MFYFFTMKSSFWKSFARVMVPGAQNRYFVFVTDCALIFFPGESCFCLLNAVALTFSLIFFQILLRGESSLSPASKCKKLAASGLRVSF